ncbi:MAG TPA: hypothetical protein DD490_26585, partial [Acidobacteria bacterium]|nr:hypothetical protein [Acidobacteriota bacterium]
MKKALWIGGGLAVVFLALLVMVFLVDFDAPRLGQAVLAEVSARSGMQIEATGFRLNLSRGLRMDGVRFASEVPGGGLTMEAASLLAEHRLLPLLRGRVEIERIVLDAPRIELVTAAETAPAAARPSAPA